MYMQSTRNLLPIAGIWYPLRDLRAALSAGGTQPKLAEESERELKLCSLPGGTVTVTGIELIYGCISTRKTVPYNSV